MTEPYPIPDAVLVHHAAFLGKTRSGKTSSAKTAVERFVAAGERVCILDPIKSDWWGMTSSVDGKAPGLPFQILGGPHGHIPLPSSSGKVIGELVATGALPLSIIDMADFEMGGLQRFFCAFAEALMRHQRGVLHLVIEEAHEFAPKERAGIGDENMGIYWAKKLATAGGSKGIRLMVATQRVQSLHNALLGSCETMVAHRLTAPADQKPVVDWLKTNVEKKLAVEIAGSLSSLRTGTAWVCSGEAQLFEKVDFPRITTFDNSATPLSDDEAHKVQTATVDVDALRGMVGEAVAEAEANDPEKLKAEIARLTRELEGKGGAPKADAEALEAENAELRGKVADLGSDIARHHGLAKEIARLSGELFGRPASELGQDLQTDRVEGMKLGGSPKGIERVIADHAGNSSEGGVHEVPLANPEKAKRAAQPDAPAARVSRSVNGSLTPALQKVVDSLAWWDAIGFPMVERNRASIIAGLSPRASTFGVYIARLTQDGLVKTEPGMVGLTDAGLELANRPAVTNKAEVVNQARSMLKPAAATVFDKIVAAYPDWVSRNKLADDCGLSRTASTLGVYISESSKLGFVDTKTGHVRAADWLFP